MESKTKREKCWRWLVGWGLPFWFSSQFSAHSFVGITWPILNKHALIRMKKRVSLCSKQGLWFFTRCRIFPPDVNLVDDKKIQMILSVNYKTVSPLGFQEAMINLGNQTSNTRPKKRNLCFSHLLTILILLILLNLEYVSAVAECLCK